VKPSQIVVDEVAQISKRSSRGTIETSLKHVTMPVVALVRIVGRSHARPARTVPQLAALVRSDHAVVVDAVPQFPASRWSPRNRLPLTHATVPFAHSFRRRRVVARAAEGKGTRFFHQPDRSRRLAVAISSRPVHKISDGLALLHANGVSQGHSIRWDITLATTEQDNCPTGVPHGSPKLLHPSCLSGMRRSHCDVLSVAQNSGLGVSPVHSTLVGELHVHASIANTVGVRR